jgi:pimeloyl-ACP methyl ester carboxylesterase
VLRLAQAHPSRVERLVLLGGGPLTSERRVPTFTRLLRSPLGEIITLEGSGGSIPLRITVKGDPETYLFARLYSATTCARTAGTICCPVPAWRMSSR